MVPGNTTKGCAALSAWMVCVLSLIVLSAPSAAQNGPPGITMPRTLPPFDPVAPACRPPEGLNKMLAFSSKVWPRNWVRWTTGKLHPVPGRPR